MISANIYFKHKGFIRYSVFIRLTVILAECESFILVAISIAHDEKVMDKVLLLCR